MTEAQIYGVLSAAIVLAGGIIGKAIRWSVTIIAGSITGYGEAVKMTGASVVKAIDDSATASRKALEENTLSNRERVKAEHLTSERLTRVEMKVDSVEVKVDKIHDYVLTPVLGVPEFDSNGVPAEMPPSERRMREPSERRRPPVRPMNGHAIDPPSDPGSYHYTRPPRR